MCKYIGAKISVCKYNVYIYIYKRFKCVVMQTWMHRDLWMFTSKPKVSLIILRGIPQQTAEGGLKKSIVAEKRKCFFGGHVHTLHTETQTETDNGHKSYQTCEDRWYRHSYTMPLICPTHSQWLVSGRLGLVAENHLSGCSPSKAFAENVSWNRRNPNKPYTWSLTYMRSWCSNWFPLIRPYFWGRVPLEGGRLTCHDHWIIQIVLSGPTKATNYLNDHLIPQPQNRGKFQQIRSLLTVLFNFSNHLWKPTT